MLSSFASPSIPGNYIRFLWNALSSVEFLRLSYILFMRAIF